MAILKPPIKQTLLRLPLLRLFYGYCFTKSKRTPSHQSLQFINVVTKQNKTPATTLYTRYSAINKTGKSASSQSKSVVVL